MVDPDDISGAEGPLQFGVFSASGWACPRVQGVRSPLWRSIRSSMARSDQVSFLESDIVVHWLKGINGPP